MAHDEYIATIEANVRVQVRIKTSDDGTKEIAEVLNIVEIQDYIER